jgi:hypothetical protein
VLLGSGDHYASAGSWIIDLIMRGILYNAIGRVMRSMSLQEVVLVAVLAVVAYLAFRRRA